MTNTEYNHYLAYKDAINLYIEMRMVLEPNSVLMIPILNYCNQQGNIIDSKCPSCLTDALIYFRYAAKKYTETTTERPQETTIAKYKKKKEIQKRSNPFTGSVG